MRNSTRLYLAAGIALAVGAVSVLRGPGSPWLVTWVFMLYVGGEIVEALEEINR